MPTITSGQSDERIPASAVDDLMRAVRLGLDQLEVELQQANLDIVQCEAHLHLEEASTRDIGAEVRAALEAASLGAQEHLGKALAAAHSHAAARIAAAEAEADWILQGAREDIVRDLVDGLRIDEPIPALDEPAQLPPSASHTELTSWAKPPAEELAQRLVELDAMQAATPPVVEVAPAPVELAAPQVIAAPTVVAPRATEPVTDARTAAEIAFWSEAEESTPRDGRGVDLALTAVSALLVLAILTILLLWIG